MTEISQKLDGNLSLEEAEATGQHVCSWSCLKNLTEECKRNDEAVYEQMKREGINRARYDLMNFKSTTFEYFDAYRILVSLDAMPKKQKKHAGHMLGAREFTLTYSPKWMDDEEARNQMKRSMNKLYKYYEGTILKLRAVGEVGSNGLSHIHCFYELEGGIKITDKNFKRAWKYWNPAKKLGKGFEGGHHATVKERSDFLGYIEKDVDTAWYDVTLPASLDPVNYVGDDYTHASQSDETASLSQEEAEQTCESSEE